MNQSLKVLENELKRQELLHSSLSNSPFANDVHFVQRYQKRVSELKQAIKIIKEHDQALNFMNN